MGAAREKQSVHLRQKRVKARNALQHASQKGKQEPITLCGAVREGMSMKRAVRGLDRLSVNRALYAVFAPRPARFR